MAPICSPNLLGNTCHLKIVATSRERLNLVEEWLLPVDGLPYPDRRAAQDAASYGAIQLFMQAARRIQLGFALNDNLDPVIDICRAVEGMPLGIELAATWLRTVPCGQIAEQVKHNVDLLTTPLRNVPERHRSLRAVFDHSWHLLSELAQHVLARLTVFRGGFDAEAAEQVAGASLPILSALVDKSMVRLDTSGRYDLHALLRQYAAATLTEHEQELLARQHFDYFLNLAAQGDPHLWHGGPDKIGWTKRLDAEVDNLRAAFAWSLACGEAELPVQLSAATGHFWMCSFRLPEGYRWLERGANRMPPSRTHR
jgi:predicted ATPase